MKTTPASPDDALTVFYDASCAICAFEIDALRDRAGASRLCCVDISAPGFDAARHGFAQRDLDAALHVVDAAGAVTRGVDALARVYGAAGLGALFSPLALPGVRGVAGAAYRAFARHRSAVSRLLSPLLSALRRRGERRAAGPGRGAR